jgi:hypothetical protein
MPNKSPEPTAVGPFSSAFAVHVASRRWLRVLCQATRYTAMNIQHLIPILFLASFCTVSAQTNNALTYDISSNLRSPHHSGIVRYPDGEPAAGVHVTLCSNRNYPDADCNYSEAISDTNGWYEILPPKKMYSSRNMSGPISAVVILTDHIMARDFEKNFAAVQEFPIGTTNVDLILKLAITFSGSVKNTEGAPISGAEIYFGFVFGGSYLETIPSIKSNDQGQFIIPVLPQGIEYNLWEIMAKGYGSFGMAVPAKDTETNHYSFPPIVLKKVDRILAER